MTEPLLAPIGALAVCGGGVGALVVLRDLAGRRARWRTAARQIVEDPANASWATTIGLRPSGASTGLPGHQTRRGWILDQGWSPWDTHPRPYDWSIDDQEGSLPCPPRSS